jgi:hypothetical protein
MAAGPRAGRASVHVRMAAVEAQNPVGSLIQRSVRLHAVKIGKAAVTEA